MEEGKLTYNCIQTPVTVQLGKVCVRQEMGGGGDYKKEKLQKLGRFVVLETQRCDILHP